MSYLVWGMGIKFSALKDRVIRMDDVKGFIDNNYPEDGYLGKPVFRPEEIETQEYEAIVVANNATDKIYVQCKNLGIDLQKVIFLYKNVANSPLVDNFSLAEKLFGKEFSDFLRSKYHIVNSPTADEFHLMRSREFQGDSLYKDDYVRISTLLFAAEEIERAKVEGSVAELGVFRGDFACNINRVFPSRKLYLFDTFEGFDEKEAATEKQKNTCNDTYIDAFKRTSIQKVMGKMPHPDLIELKVGLFPQSLEGLEDKFAFVSIDVDFEESTYAGLNYFYPRLSKGGYIFLHDYNCGYLDIVRKAVEHFEKDNGTLVITK